MSRRTYRAKLEFLFQMDDEQLSEVKRLVQEQVNVMYHAMERDDIRISLQTDFGVSDTGASNVGYEACWKEIAMNSRPNDRRHCRKPKGHDGDCAPF
jgi:hypothetical protein